MSKVIGRKPTAIKSWGSWHWWLLRSTCALALAGAVGTVGYPTRAQIEPDNTLGPESSRVTSNTPGAFQIEGGATRGINLFHSFSQFSVPTNGIAFFNNAASIQNIISRVTGGSVSTIDGLLKANGTANLFLLNPNGIIFGRNASLSIGGSFVASTANSLNFADGTKFSATAPPTISLLTVSVPIGLQFGPTSGEISVQGPGAVRDPDTDRLLNAGLTVSPQATLALVGSGLSLEGGILTTKGGRIELGSVDGPGLVRLTSSNKGWTLDYSAMQNFGDLQLSQQAAVDASGEGGGDVQVRGRRITLSDGSVIEASTLGFNPGGNLVVNASELLEIIGTSSDGQTSSGLAADVYQGATGTGGNLTINTGRLLVRDGAQVSASTYGQGRGGDLTVNASQGVKLSGFAPYINGGITYSGLLTFVGLGASGNAGNLKLNTSTLLIQDGAVVNANTYGQGNGGDLTVNASQGVKLSGFAPYGNGQIFSSGLLTRARPNSSGNAGNLIIDTPVLQVLNEAQVAVDSEGTGAAGNLKITSPSIFLDSGAISAATTSGQGNIDLDSQDLLLRHGSQLSTSATGPTTGGNITIKTGVLTVLEGSNIGANSQESFGGRVMIHAQGIFRSPESVITATSALGPQFSGTVQINTLVNNPSQGVVTLPIKPVDVTGRIAQGCPAGVGPRASKFVVTGRGGLPPDPTEALRSEPTLADLGTTVQSRENPASATPLNNPVSSQPAPLVEAQGWITNAQGEVVLVAQAPTVTP